MKKNYLLLCLLPLLSIGQIQIGSDINGEAASDYSGVAVSASSDGSIVAIGARSNDGNGVDSGHVRVYQNLSGDWTQIGEDIDGEAASDYSGTSVSLSSDGSIVAIGAFLNSGRGAYSGHVRVYQNLSGIWTKIGNDIDGEAAADYSGTSVSLSSDGNIVAIGAESNNGNGTDSGHVRVYQNLSGVWTQIGDDIDGEAAGDYSGSSVSLSSSGTIVAIGAPNNSGNGFNSGHVRVYQNLSGDWIQIGDDIDGEAAGDRSGSSVSVSSDGSIVAIGARSNDGNGVDSGHVRVYQNQSGVWKQVGDDIDGEATGDYSGSNVSLSSNGNIVAIGAPNSSGNGFNSGQVRVYQYLSGVWSQNGADIDGEATGDNLGTCVSLSSNGNRVAIGACANGGNGIASGQVRIYDLIAILGSDSFVLASFSIYPNPASEMINIALQDNLTFEKVNIYNTSGQLIKTENKKEISICDFSKGHYFFEVITDKGKATKTIVVK